jgi:hypothetical protein
MASILFLMLAFLETLEEEYEEWGIKPIEFKYHADILKGQLKSQSLQCQALTFCIGQLLYVDDTFFPFATRDDLIQGTNRIFHLFRCFGLLMHIGKVRLTHIDGNVLSTLPTQEDQ